MVLFYIVKAACTWDSEGGGVTLRRTYLRRIANTLIWISGILIVFSFIAKEGFHYQAELALIPIFFAIGLVGLIIILIMGLI